MSLGCPWGCPWGCPLSLGLSLGMSLGIPLVVAPAIAQAMNKGKALAQNFTHYRNQVSTLVRIEKHIP